MINLFYDIKTKSHDTITVKFNTGDPNKWTTGETASFTFEFPTFHSDLTVTDSYTVGPVEGYGTVTVENGATLTVPSGNLLQAEQLVDNGTTTVNGTIRVTSGLSTAFNEYMQWAGSWAPMTMLNNKEKYRMQFPSSATIGSLVWGITPNTDLSDRNVVGVWGLVENMENERNQALNINRYSVDVTVLAPIDDYATISDVENDLVI